jgi:hypothetical protein
MFARLQALFAGAPRVGDPVAVLDGPYARQTGTVTAVDAGRLTVYIDECCQPTLPRRAVRRLRAGRATERAQHPAGTDEEYEVARTRIRQIPPTR